MTTGYNKGLTDEQVEALVRVCPVEGYAMLCEMPGWMETDQFRATLLAWARAVLSAAREEGVPPAEPQ